MFGIIPGIWGSRCIDRLGSAGPSAIRPSRYINLIPIAVRIRFPSFSIHICGLASFRRSRSFLRCRFTLVSFSSFLVDLSLHFLSSASLLLLSLLAGPTMASGLLRVVAIAASVTQAVASCAYGTHLAPRAEEGGEIKVNTFAYTGTQVRCHIPDCTKGNTY